MIESIIEWSIRNQFVVILAAVVLGLAGLRALSDLPVDAIPDLSEKQVIVFTDWPGRSPREIEDQISYPLSVNLQGLAGVKVVRSSSEFNFSMINIIFTDETDYYFARQRVLERLSIASTFLPPGVTPYLAPDATALGQIFWYTVEGDGRDLGELRAIQDWYVKYQLNSVPGVAEVASVGGAPREYQIDLDPSKLRAYGVTLGEVYTAVQRANSAVGGRVIHQGNAEYLVRSVGWIRGLNDLRQTVVTRRGIGTPISLKDLGAVQLGPGYRRGALEKGGREVVGGVVLMRHGENPLAVTRRVKEKITTLQAGLPDGVRIVPFYDRTPLIRKALATVSDTVKQELIICTFMILLIMGHLGGAFVVSLSLPLAVLFSILMMRLAGIPSNIMSLAGIAISVGILEDQAVVMTENAAHHLTRRFGREKIRGDIREYVIPACRTVGRPIFFSVLITILSFLPVFALQGTEGKMFHPLAWTKTFALIGVAVLAITLVPALIPIFLKGRIKSEDENWLVRTMTEIFRPMLNWLMDRPTLVCWSFACIVGLGYVASTKLGREFMPELNEGSIMDMPTTVPRISITQASDDLKARDAILRSFPEVLQVVGKAGRAETATDPSPLDMIETIINLRDHDLWPKRHFRFEDVLKQTTTTQSALLSMGILQAKPGDDSASLLNDVAMGVSTELDRVLRELADLRFNQFRPELARGLLGDLLEELLNRLDKRHVKRPLLAAERESLVDDLSRDHGEVVSSGPSADDVAKLLAAAVKGMTAIGVLADAPDLLALTGSTWDQVASFVSEQWGIRPPGLVASLTETLARREHDRTAEWLKSLNWELFDRAVVVATEVTVRELTRLGRERRLLTREPSAQEIESLLATLQPPLSQRLFLWRKTHEELVKELDTAANIPGWGNIWTQPIINRINMLATGVRSDIGVKVFGSDLNEIQRVSREIAATLKQVRGAVDVFPDQIVGKGYIEIEIDREKAARVGLAVADVQEVVEVALGGKPVTMTVEGRERYPVRVRYGRDQRDNIESLKGILVSAEGSAGTDATSDPSPGTKPSTSSGERGRPPQIPLSQVAEVRMVEGPSVIKSENGLLRAYVQLNVRDRDLIGFVEDAQRVVAASVSLPTGMYLEWAGEFENQIRARKTLQVMFPAVIALIVLLLYLTYRNWVDAALILPSVVGALAGGAMFQWLFGVNFSVAVWVGYIACFGMAVETAVVMMVYLREAVRERGGLERIGSIAELKEAVLDGAIHRLRPKLLTEGTTIIAIAPMLWADGVGSEVIRPMAAPVLGGLLIADEVIDVMLPVFYFVVQKHRWRKLRGIAPWEEVTPVNDPTPQLVSSNGIEEVAVLERDSHS